MRNIKKHCHKKVIVRFYNFGITFVIFSSSIMALFEIHQRFKGHFLNELRVSFKFFLFVQPYFKN